MAFSEKNWRNGKLIVLCSLVCLIFSNGCGHPLPHTLPSSESIRGGEAEPIAQSYRLGANDVVRIQVFDEPELTIETEVSGQGKVNFPLLGELNIGGKTLREVEKYVSDRLKDGYINDPKVHVYIIRYRNIFVSGEVRAPGAYPYQEGLTILRAITIAGGFTEKAAKESVQVLRIMNEQESLMEVSMDDPIQPDDVLVIPESFF